uniref:Dolichyl-diphosphooligosaccharide--protein glycosyltransferase subunit 2 n=1 Tax=Tetranychus urticae TaxID=32264 RepID=T1K5G7_TETUR
MQADEVDGRFLQFEGGLGVTANIILGIYSLASSLNEPHLSVKRIHCNRSVLHTIGPIIWVSLFGKPSTTVSLLAASSTLPYYSKLSRLW